MSAPLNPPSFAESNATLYSDQPSRLLQKINNLCGGSSKAAAVTPSDASNLPQGSGRIYVGSTGGGSTLKVDTFFGQTLTFNVTAGQTLPIHVRKVYATGMLASQLVVIY